MADQSCPTVQIQTAPSEGNPDGVVTINAEDYDEETMTLVGDAPVVSVATAPVAHPVLVQTPAVNSLDGTLAPPPWASKL